MRTLARTLVFLTFLGCGTTQDGASDASVTDTASLPSDAAASDGAVTDAAIPTLPTTLGTTERPAMVVRPNTVPESAPLIVLLHGYTSSAAAQDVYLGVSRVARTMGVFVLLPNGTVDGDGSPFWNATPACCDFGNTGVDDVGYLRDLVHEAVDRLPIDPTRVYFIGHSNGGFMSYRMACEMSDEIAAIVVLAGSDYASATACVPTAPVSVFHMHGTDDDTILYAGQTGGYPGAVEVTERWAAHADCNADPVTLDGALDWISSIDGAETDVIRYDGCATGFNVQLNRINGAGHVPFFAAGAMEGIVGWLTEHHR